jgi:hypothetical protein
MVLGMGMLSDQKAGEAGALRKRIDLSAFFSVIGHSARRLRE